jgi:uncharacterized membrane protein
MERVEAALSPAERHFTHRLEAFGDVVFGFTISQLAFGFTPPRAPADLLDNPVKYVIYAVTFGLIALLWIRYHRMLSSAFRPQPADLVIVFTYLAFTGLVPYAMSANVRLLANYASSTYGFGAYMICAVGTQTMAALLAARNYRRAAPFMSFDEALALYKRLVITAATAGLCVVLLIGDVVVGPVAGFGFAVLWFMPDLIRRRVRTIPGRSEVVTAGPS